MFSFLLSRAPNQSSGIFRVLFVYWVCSIMLLVGSICLSLRYTPHEGAGACYARCVRFSSVLCVSVCFCLLPVGTRMDNGDDNGRIGDGFEL